MDANLKTSLTAVCQLIGILILMFGLISLAMWLDNHGHEKILRIGGGTLVDIIGVLILIFGNKDLKIKGGVILDTFFPSNYPTKAVMSLLGIALTFLGTSLILNDF